MSSFEYRLHPVGPIVLAGPIFHPLEDAREVLAFYREFIATVPDQLTTIFELSVAPPAPSLPEHVHGKPIVMVGACYAGAPEDGIEVVRPLKQFGYRHTRAGASMSTSSATRGPSGSARPTATGSTSAWSS